MLRRGFVLFFSLLTLGSAGLGVYAAVHSDLFLVQVVEVADQPDESPLDARSITELAAIPVGKANLFTLDLRAIEKRLLSNPWVRAVTLQKRFPQTVSIAVTFREPRALYQSPNGALSYLDADGNAFGKVSLTYSRDLPLLSGFSGESPFRISEALRLLDGWEKSSLPRLSSISSLTWDRERGFRALATYYLEAPSTAPRRGVDLGPKSVATGHSAANRTPVRVMVEFGHEIDAHWEDDSRRLADVFRYLGQHAIAAHQIWADAGKKIVVKTARGS